MTQIEFYKLLNSNKETIEQYLHDKSLSSYQRIQLIQKYNELNQNKQLDEELEVHSNVTFTPVNNANTAYTLLLKEAKSLDEAIKLLNESGKIDPNYEIDKVNSYVNRIHYYIAVKKKENIHEKPDGTVKNPTPEVNETKTPSTPTQTNPQIQDNNQQNNNEKTPQTPTTPVQGQDNKTTPATATNIQGEDKSVGDDGQVTPQDQIPAVDNPQADTPITVVTDENGNNLSIASSQDSNVGLDLTNPAIKSSAEYKALKGQAKKDANKAIELAKRKQKAEKEAAEKKRLEDELKKQGETYNKENSTTTTETNTTKQEEWLTVKRQKYKDVHKLDASQTDPANMHYVNFKQDYVVLIRKKPFFAATAQQRYDTSAQDGPEVIVEQMTEEKKKEEEAKQTEKKELSEEAKKKIEEAQKKINELRAKVKAKQEEINKIKSAATDKANTEKTDKSSDNKSNDDKSTSDESKSTETKLTAEQEKTIADGEKEIKQWQEEIAKQEKIITDNGGEVEKDAEEEEYEMVKQPPDSYTDYYHDNYISIIYIEKEDKTVQFQQFSIINESNQINIHDNGPKYKDELNYGPIEFKTEEDVKKEKETIAELKKKWLAKDFFDAELQKIIEDGLKKYNLTKEQFGDTWPKDILKDKTVQTYIQKSFDSLTDYLTKREKYAAINNKVTFKDRVITLETKQKKVANTNVAQGPVPLKDKTGRQILPEDNYLRAYQVNNFINISVNTTVHGPGTCSVTIKGAERVICAENNSQAKNGWFSWSDLVGGWLNINEGGTYNDGTGVGTTTTSSLNREVDAKEAAKKANATTDSTKRKENYTGINNATGKSWKTADEDWDGVRNGPFDTDTTFRTLFKTREAKYGWRFAEKCDWEPMDEILIFGKSLTLRTDDKELDDNDRDPNTGMLNGYKHNNQGMFKMEQIFFGYIEQVSKTYDASRGCVISVTAKDHLKLLELSRTNTNVGCLNPGQNTPYIPALDWSDCQYGMVRIINPILYMGENKDGVQAPADLIEVSKSDPSISEKIRKNYAYLGNNFTGWYPDEIVQIIAVQAGVPEKFVKKRVEPFHQFVPFLAGNDQKSIEAFKGDTESAYSLCQKVAQKLMLEFFADEEGNIVLKIPNWVLSVNMLQMNNCNIKYKDGKRNEKLPKFTCEVGEDGVPRLKIDVSEGGSADSSTAGSFSGLTNMLNNALTSLTSQFNIGKLPDGVIPKNLDPSKIGVEWSNKLHLSNKPANSDNKGGSSETVGHALGYEDNLVYAALTEETIDDILDTSIPSIKQLDDHTILIKTGRWFESKIGSLYNLAKRYYGNGRKWKLIAEANDIKDPTELIPGQIIKIVFDDSIKDYMLMANAVDDKILPTDVTDEIYEVHSNSYWDTTVIANNSDEARKKWLKENSTMLAEAGINTNENILVEVSQAKDNKYTILLPSHWQDAINAWRLSKALNKTIKPSEIETVSSLRDDVIHVTLKNGEKYSVDGNNNAEVLENPDTTSENKPAENTENKGNNAPATDQDPVDVARTTPVTLAKADDGSDFTLGTANDTNIPLDLSSPTIKSSPEYKDLKGERKKKADQAIKRAQQMKKDNIKEAQRQVQNKENSAYNQLLGTDLAKNLNARNEAASKFVGGRTDMDIPVLKSEYIISFTLMDSDQDIYNYVHVSGSNMYRMGEGKAWAGRAVPLWDNILQFGLRPHPAMESSVLCGNSAMCELMGAMLCYKSMANRYKAVVTAIDDSAVRVGNPIRMYMYDEHPFRNASYIMPASKENKPGATANTTNASTTDAANSQEGNNEITFDNNAFIDTNKEQSKEFKFNVLLNYDFWMYRSEKTKEFMYFAWEFKKNKSPNLVKIYATDEDIDTDQKFVKSLNKYYEDSFDKSIDEYVKNRREAGIKNIPENYKANAALIALKTKYMDSINNYVKLREANIKKGTKVTYNYKEGIYTIEQINTYEELKAKLKEALDKSFDLSKADDAAVTKAIEQWESSYKKASELLNDWKTNDKSATDAIFAPLKDSLDEVHNKVKENLKKGNKLEIDYENGKIKVTTNGETDKSNVNTAAVPSKTDDKDKDTTQKTADDVKAAAQKVTLPSDEGYEAPIFDETIFREQACFYIESMSRSIDVQNVSTMTLQLRAGRMMGQSSCYDIMSFFYNLYYKPWQTRQFYVDRGGNDTALVNPHALEGEYEKSLHAAYATQEMLNTEITKEEQNRQMEEAQKNMTSIGANITGGSSQVETQKIQLQQQIDSLQQKNKELQQKVDSSKKTLNDWKSSNKDGKLNKNIDDLQKAINDMETTIKNNNEEKIPALKQQIKDLG